MIKDIWMDREGLEMERDINSLHEMEVKTCSQCGYEEPESEMVLDFIQENHICDRKKCIRQSMENDLEYYEGSEHNKVAEYYGKMLE